MEIDEIMSYPFTEEEATRANDEWGANCGPNALAFILRRKLHEVRSLVPGFEQKRYTSPTMMAQALRFDGIHYVAIPEAPVSEMCHAKPALVRVQWTGKWTEPGANPKWAYIHTHWICCWKTSTVHSQAGVPVLDCKWVFDCNGGVRSLSSWIKDIVPLLATGARRDGGWFPTHIWRLQ